jgi:hypothetical protein
LSGNQIKPNYLYRTNKFKEGAYMFLGKIKLLLPVIAVVALLYSPIYSNDIDTSKTYYIQTAKEYGRGIKGFWNIPGDPKRFKSGQNIKIWDLSSKERRKYDRAFRFKRVRSGVYVISCILNKNSRVDIAGRGTKNGTNIRLWNRNNNKYSQQYRIRYRGKGRWEIFTMKGKVVCIPSHSSKNGSNVSIWKYHNSSYTKWVFIPRNTYRAYIPGKKKAKRRVAKVRLRGLTANIVYTGKLYKKAVNVGYLLKKRGMKVKYTKTKNGNAYAGKLFYRKGYHNQARSIQNIIGKYVKVAPQVGQTKYYRDKQFNIGVTQYVKKKAKRRVANVKLKGLTAHIFYTKNYYKKAVSAGNLLKNKGMRIKYVKTKYGKRYAGRLFYRNGYDNQAKSIRNLIGKYVKLKPRISGTNLFKNKQFIIGITEKKNEKRISNRRSYVKKAKIKNKGNYRRFKFVDIQLDLNSLIGKKVKTKAQATYYQGILMLFHSLVDTSPLAGDIKNISRKNRKYLFTNCTARCIVLIYGRVGKIKFKNNTDIGIIVDRIEIK